MANTMQGAGDRLPVPDPTLLTTQQLTGAIGALREVMETRIEGQGRLFDSRIDGMDKAIKLLQTIADRIPNLIDEKVTHLRELHAEKFDSVQQQFTERDVRVDQSATQTKTAVDAALQAAKEANGKQYESFNASIAKSEASTTKQMDQQAEQTRTKTTAIDAQISDMKERLTRIEGEDRGQKTAVTQQQTSNTAWVGIIGLVIGAVIGFAGIAIAIFH